jgi:hypothetical protein
VLIVHEWWGYNEHARYHAKRLAEADKKSWAAMLELFKEVFH